MDEEVIPSIPPLIAVLPRHGVILRRQAIVLRRVLCGLLFENFWEGRQRGGGNMLAALVETENDKNEYKINKMVWYTYGHEYKRTNHSEIGD